MPKWNLSEHNIYYLLKSSSNNDKLDEDTLSIAYKGFVEEIVLFLDKESNYKILIRELNVTFIEFESLKRILESDQESKCRLKLLTCNKVLSFINKELDLLYRQMEFPKYFINIETGFISPLHLDKDMAKYIDIMEIVCGLYYLKCITTVDGKEIHFSDLATAFEKLFNIKFGDIYKKEEAVIKRKQPKVTEFLDRLKTAIIQKGKDEGYY